jgi:lectin-like protein
MFGVGSAAPGGGASAGMLSVAGRSGAQSGAGNGGVGSGGSGAETSAGRPGNAGGDGSGVGCAFSCGDGGNAGAAGGNEEAGSGAEPSECSALAADAKFLPSTQHCYLIDSETRTFAAARMHCEELKAHLVTLSSEAENDFAWSIHSDEHWIGSQDGKAPKQSGVGTYIWVTGEPFKYTNWSPNEPNATKTDCVEGGAECYEHCAFQWKGGDHDSQWNDRYCMHTIASICEWDSVP